MSEWENKIKYENCKNCPNLSCGYIYDEINCQYPEKNLQVIKNEIIFFLTDIPTYLHDTVHEYLMKAIKEKNIKQEKIK